MVTDVMGMAILPCQPVRTALEFHQATPALCPTSSALPLVRLRRCPTRDNTPAIKKM